jgi:hypothetical protein
MNILVAENFNQISQNLDIGNALIFTNAAAIGFSIIRINNIGIIFIIAFGIAYLLRKKNLPDEKLGIKAIILVLNYFVANIFFILILWPIIQGNQNAIDFVFILKTIFSTGNINILVAAGFAYYLATNKRIFKNLNKGVDSNQQ